MSYGIFKKAIIAEEEYEAPDIEAGKREELHVSSDSEDAK